MTKLSVNINKVALLRNARGRDFPNVGKFARQCLDLGAHGITLHPRQDQRHARYSDISELGALCKDRGAELNVEGYPSEVFMAAVMASPPTQCTLVPDSPDQLTSDHGWTLRKEGNLLRRVIRSLRDQGIRVSLFVDFDDPDLAAAREVGADRVELYTEPYASAFGSPEEAAILAGFRNAASRAQKAGLGVNAGHDLNLENLASFVGIADVLEVSIGHALVVESIELGLSTVVRRYLDIVARSNTANKSPDPTPPSGVGQL